MGHLLTGASDNPTIARFLQKLQYASFELSNLERSTAITKS